MEKARTTDHWTSGETCPPPETLDTLGFGEQFLVWCVRIWAQANHPDCKDPAHFSGQLRRAFDLAGLPETDLVFDRFLTVFLSSLKVPLSIHYPCCRGVSRDEIAFLRLVADVQRGRATDTYMTLSDYLAPAGVRHAMMAVQELSVQLELKRLVMRPFDIPGERQERDRVMPESATVH